MRKSIVAAFIVIGSLNVYSQKKAEDPFKTESIVLITPWDFSSGKAVFSSERRLKSCMDFESLTLDCNFRPSISYGSRVGVNWDLFQIGGAGGQTRMVEIGEYDWTDRFTIPYVELWKELAPGEKRAMTINASGTTVKGEAPKSKKGPSTPKKIDGVADMNGNGTFTPIPRGPVTYANADVKLQVTSTVKGSDGNVRSNPYTPVVEAKKGHMYVAHVIDRDRDYYVIIHVDELERGERIKLSILKLDLAPL